MKHTPGEWKVEELHGRLDIRGGQDFSWIARIMGGTYDTAQANAEFIVKACNCHDELLEACQSALGYLVAAFGLQPQGWQQSAMQQIQAAIAKAE